MKLFPLFYLACFSLKAAADTPQPDAVVASAQVVTPLTQDTFKAFAHDHPQFVALFHASYSRPSQKMLRKFTLAGNKAASQYADDSVPFASVECGDNMRMCTSFGITGFPPARLIMFNLTHPNPKQKLQVIKLESEKHNEVTFLAQARALLGKTSFFQALEEWNYNGNVVHMAPVHFHERHKSGQLAPHTLVFFYSKTCSRSQKLMPRFATASETSPYDAESMLFVAVNCQLNNIAARFCTTMGVIHYPKISLYVADDQWGAEPMADFEVGNDFAPAQLITWLRATVQKGISPAKSEL